MQGLGMDEGVGWCWLDSSSIEGLEMLVVVDVDARDGDILAVVAWDGWRFCAVLRLSRW